MVSSLFMHADVLSELSTLYGKTLMEPGAFT